MTMTPKSTLISMIITSCSLPWASYGQCQYQISAVIQGPECGVFGFPPTFGSAISDTAEVVGWYTACTIGTDEAFYWSEKTGFVTLDRPPGVFAAMASDISNEGTIVGTYQKNDIGNRGFIYKDGQWTELLPNEGGLYSWANAVSADGSTVVGSRTGALGGSGVSPYQAYVYDVATATFTDLGVMNGPSSWATDVAGQFVTGVTGSVSSFTPDEGFRWSNGELEMLGLPFEATTAGTSGVNPSGTVVGGAAVPIKGRDSTVGLPVAWPLDGDALLLPILAGYGSGSALAISNAGIVVGRASNSSSDERALLIQAGLALDLNERIAEPFEGELRRAVDVNTSGQILVRGYDADGNNVAFLLSPIESSQADLNGDCAIEAGDLMILLDSWGACDQCTADLDGNGIVGPADLANLLAEWG